MRFAEVDEIIPANEAERLAAVRRYDILDTPPDGAFDRITALAARLFGVPIAIVSIVDHDRIWFKSHHGVEAEEIGRDPGLCASAILGRDAYVVTDAAADRRTLANPLVAGEMGLRFYAAAPLTTPDGYNLGTVCVLDTKPREVTEEERSTLRDLAAVVVDELELRRAAKTLHAQEAELLDAATRFAKTLQQSLLPAELPEVPGAEIAAYFQAGDPSEVSGDFYDVFPVGEGRWAIAVGDVAGKGPTAAAATSLVRYSLRTAALAAQRPADVLETVNRTMIASEYFGIGREPGFCTVVFAILECVDGGVGISIARAGHVRPIIVLSDGTVRSSAADGPLLGMLDAPAFATETVVLRADDLVVLYTDGLPEARDGDDILGTERLCDCLAGAAGKGAAQVVDRIRSLIASFEPGVRDDIAVLVVRGAR